MTATREHEVNSGQFDPTAPDPDRLAVSQLFVKANGKFSALGVDGMFFNQNYDELRFLTNDELVAKLADAESKDRPAVWTGTIAAILAHRANSLAEATGGVTSSDNFARVDGRVYRLTPA